MEEFYKKYVKKNKNKIIKSEAVSSTFPLTGAIIKELRNPSYNVFKYPGNELPPAKNKIDFEEANKITNFLVLAKNDDNIVAIYPYGLLYIIAPDLYEKYRNAATIDLEKVIKNKNKDESEKEKFMKKYSDYVLTDIFYKESLYYYPVLSEIIDDPDFEKYIVIYPESRIKELPENIEELPAEERAKTAKNTTMTVLFIHKKTKTPLTTPFGTFIIIEPKKAKKLWKKAKIITPREFIEVMQKIIR